jgi:outer membrane protein OmpA-like peptidoglycan-associated protein
MKHILFSVLTVLLFGFSNAQESNLHELVDNQEDIVVKIKKRRIGGKYTVRVNNDTGRDTQEERYYFDNRLKYNSNRHVMYFDSKEDVNKYLSRHGYNLNKGKHAYWDHPSGDKNRNVYRNGTAKIGSTQLEGEQNVHNKDVYVFSKGGTYTAFPKSCASSCSSSKCAPPPPPCNKKKSCKSKSSCSSAKALYSVYFKTDQSDIKVSELSGIADALNKNKNLNLRIEGNADIRGTSGYNKALAQKRAKRCYEILTKEYGISANRLAVKSNGEGRPIYQGLDKNRRVDFLKM